MLLTSSQWNRCIIGAITPTLDMDNDHPPVAKNSLEILQQELLWGIHLGRNEFEPFVDVDNEHDRMLGVHAIYLPTPRENCFHYAQLVNTIASPLTYQQLWINIPLIANFEYCNTDISDGWLIWHRFHMLTGHNPHIYIALDLTQINGAESEPEYLNRWRGEHVKAVVLHTRNFVKNTAGYPVLPKAYQSILTLFIDLNVHIILIGRRLSSIVVILSK